MGGLRNKIKRQRLFVLAAIVLILAALWAYWRVYTVSDELRVWFLDVGQGDAALIQTPFGQNILIDGGPDYQVVNQLNKSLSWYDRSLDLVILTHPHDDHVAGLIPVLKKYHVKRILYTGVVADAPIYQEWLKTVKAFSVPLLISDKAQRISFGTECFLDIKFPVASLVGLTVENLNDSSIVSELDCAGKKILFMGDAEAPVETALREAGVLADVDILKAGHHGSDTSTSQEFLAAVRPETTIISVGKDNDYGHPSLRILKRLERAQSAVLRTDLSGTIILP